MSLAIGLYQFELSHPNQAPHIGMCLFINDLIEDGHSTRAALVAQDAVEQLLDEIRAHRFDLLALDSIFPIDVIEQIKQTFPQIPIVVGGVNALALFLESPADFAVVGPGRRAVRALARHLAASTVPDDVPNLFHRLPDGRIDHTGVERVWNLDEELRPYRPYLDWDYVGQGRTRDANSHQLSVVPEFGCVYQDDAFSTEAFADLNGADPAAELASHRLTERAVEAVRPYFDNARGCSFCVFRFQTLTLAAVEPSVALCMEQLEALQSMTGASQFSLQTENPFRILEPLLDAIAARNLRVSRKLCVEALLIRTLPSVLLHKEAALRRALECAREAGTVLILQQLGFETFAGAQLERYNKGISATDNRRAARLLTELKQEFGDTLDCFTGHGLMLFDPWTTLDELADNVAAIDTDAPFLARAVGIGARLVFYDPFNPIFRKARAHGLVVASRQHFGWDFRFADKHTEDFVQMVMALNRHLAKATRRQAEDAPNSRGAVTHEGWVFRRALECYRAALGDADRLRQAFFDVAGEIDARVASG